MFTSLNDENESEDRDKNADQLLKDTSIYKEGLNLAFKGRSKEALSLLDQINTSSPLFSLACFNKALLLPTNKQYIQEKLHLYSLSEENYQSYLEIGKVAEKNSLYFLALECYKKLLTISDSPPLIIKKSLEGIYRTYYLKGDFDDALKYIKMVLSFSPQNLQALWTKQQCINPNVLSQENLKQYNLENERLMTLSRKFPDIIVAQKSTVGYPISIGVSKHTITIEKLCWSELVNATLKIYEEVTENSIEEASLFLKPEDTSTVQIKIEVVNPMDISETAKPTTNESINVVKEVNFTSFKDDSEQQKLPIIPDQGTAEGIVTEENIGETFEDQMETEKIKTSATVESNSLKRKLDEDLSSDRTAKRILRSKLETNTTQKKDWSHDILWKELGTYFPINLDFGEAGSIISDENIFFDGCWKSFYNLVNAVKEKKLLTHKPKKQVENFKVNISIEDDEVVLVETKRSIEKFIKVVNDAEFDIIEVLQHLFLTFYKNIINDEVKLIWTNEKLFTPLMLILRKLEFHNAGLRFFNCYFENNIIRFDVICEVLFYFSPRKVDNSNIVEVFDVSDGDFNSNPLYSTSIWNMFLRWFSETDDIFNNLNDFAAKDLGLVVRFLWLKANFEKKVDRIENSAKILSELKIWLLELNSQNKSANFLINPFSRFITEKKIDQNLRMLDARQFLKEANNFNIKDSKLCLHKILMPSLFDENDDSNVLNEDTIEYMYEECGLARRSYLRNLLETSLIDKEEKFVLNVVAFLDVIRNLNIGEETNYIMAYSIVEKIMEHMTMSNSESVFNTLNNRKNIRYFSEFKNNTNDPNVSEFDDTKATFLDQFVYNSFLLLKISFSALTYIDQVPNQKFNENISKLTVLCFTYSYYFFKLMEFLLKKKMPTLEEEQEDDTKKPKVSKLKAEYDWIGMFLNLVKSYFDNGRDNRELYQCYFCLYGVYIKVDNDVQIDDHSSEKIAFTTEPASEAFESVYNFILYKLNSKSYRDKVLQNKLVINKYLESEMDLSEIGFTPSKKLALINIKEEENKSIPDIFFNIYYINGKILWAQQKFNKATRTESNKKNLIIDSAIENFMNDLYLNPYSFDSWLTLAVFYAGAASDLLLWSANEITTKFKKIREFQIKAFHCFSQAIQIFRKRKKFVESNRYQYKNKEVAANLWGEFGNLIHQILTKPMSSASLVSNYNKIKLKICTEENIKLAIPSIEVVNLKFFKFGIWLFERAIKFDSSNWWFPFMIARFYEKIDFDSKIALKYYKLSCKLVPEEWPTKEQEIIFDPYYKLLSYLIKLLAKNKIKPDIVKNIVDECIPKNWIIDVTLSQETNEVELISSSQEKIADGTKVSWTTETALQQICQIYNRMTFLDKKHWHHKAAFKVAWIQYHLLKNPVEAQAKIQTLLNYKSFSKSFINFWKPEFERPGKHFIYIHKYTKFLIEILYDVQDENSIEYFRNISRKVKKADEFFLYPKEIWDLVFEKYFNVLRSSIESHGSTQLSGSMTKNEFDVLTTPLEQEIFNNEDKKVQILLRAFELNKLNDEENEMLQLFLVEVYSKLFIQFGGLEMKKTCSVEGMKDQGPLLFNHVLSRVKAVCKLPPKPIKNSEVKEKELEKVPPTTEGLIIETEKIGVVNSETSTTNNEESNTDSKKLLINGASKKDAAVTLSEIDVLFGKTDSEGISLGKDEVMSGTANQQSTVDKDLVMLEACNHIVDKKNSITSAEDDEQVDRLVVFGGNDVECTTINKEQHIVVDGDEADTSMDLQYTLDLDMGSSDIVVGETFEGMDEENLTIPENSKKIDGEINTKVNVEYDSNLKAEDVVEMECLISSELEQGETRTNNLVFQDEKNLIFSSSSFSDDQPQLPFENFTREIDLDAFSVNIDEDIITHK
ncbi:Histone transcription regulator 3 [Clydaea vesicula]|uniref:Histone transcription regulator 3 n=1 Tax=Clydaea vesicula TaxID=447962 RepID=A0AAD5TWA5_9FUNG|nr:Histone transcription regulator 3 [Clydaea vesicula]